MIVDPNCQICQHEQRIQIDLSTQTVGQRATAKRFDVSRQSIQRHLEKGHSDDDSSASGEGTPTVSAQTPKVNTPSRTVKSVKEKRPQKPQKPEKPQPPPADDVFADDAEPDDEPEQHESKTNRAIGTIRDYANRKRYLGTLLQTGSFRGMSTLNQLQSCWPDLTMLQLAEVVAQAAMELDFFRGTRQTRRLVALARAERIFRKTMGKGDEKTALRTLEFIAKQEGTSAEPDLMAALAASQAWAIAARVLQSKFPEAFEAIHGELVAEEARKRQALAPTTVVESDHAAE
jgi:hypothetical protein